MPKGYAIDWTQELEDRLRDLYPMHLDTEVAEMMGLCYKSIRHHARLLGLTKGEGYDEYSRRRMSEINSQRTKGKPNKGKFQKGHRPAVTFPKGRPPQEMIDRRAETLRKRYREDKVRIKYGLEPKMKFKLKVKYNLNEYLK